MVNVRSAIVGPYAYESSKRLVPNLTATPRRRRKGLKNYLEKRPVPIPYACMTYIPSLHYHLLHYPREYNVWRHLVFVFGDGAFVHPKTRYTNGVLHLVIEIGLGVIALNLMTALYPTTRRHLDVGGPGGQNDKIPRKSGQMP